MKIADNDFYSIEADGSKNRIYLTIKGFWQDINQIKGYLDDIKNAANSVNKGFTILSDLTTMKTPTQEIGELHVKAQQVLVDAGLSKTAEVHPASTVTQLSLKRFSEESGMQKGLFPTREEAEKWLDS